MCVVAREPTRSVPRILMVEDDEMTFALVRHRLEREGMEVELKTRGSDVIDLMAEDGSARHYDLVLLDVKLPGVDGFEILQEMRDEDDR